jgi:hypothetical protein
MWRLLVIFFLSALPALAQNDAKTVATLCEKAVSGSGQRTVCSSYVRGVLDANQLWYTAMMKEQHFSLLARFYCAPTTLETKDAAKLFVDWLNRNPAHETDPAANAIDIALREKYPCK